MEIDKYHQYCPTCKGDGIVFTATHTPADYPELEAEKAAFYEQTMNKFDKLVKTLEGNNHE